MLVNTMKLNRVMSLEGLELFGFPLSLLFSIFLVVSIDSPIRKLDSSLVRDMQRDYYYSKMSICAPKKANICCQLISREYVTRGNQHQSHNILKMIMTKCDYKFSKVWSQCSGQRISCEGNMLFFKNYSECYDCTTHQPYRKFSLQRTATGKIADALLMDGFPETVELPLKGYQVGMLCVTKNNLLLRVNLQTGTIHEEVYISPATVSFRTIQWNVIGRSVTLISKHFPKERMGLNQMVDSTKVKQLIIMSLYPLQFVCKFTVTKRVFGRYATDVSVFINLLVVMYSSGQVRMYSLEHILEKHKTHDQKLYDTLSEGGKYGTYPSHLTENIDLTEVPPCLFEVRCRDRDVMLTLPPCYYIMWPFKEETGYCCYSFESGKMVKEGRLSQPSDIDSYEDRVALHADDSGRIVHMTNTQLRILKLQHNQEDNGATLVEDFTIMRHVKPKSPTLKVSRSGRILKQRVREDSVDLPERHTDCATVGFYDNWSGELLREFTLEENVEEMMERSISFYLDTFIHLYKTNQGQFQCHVYKLRACLDPGDDWTASSIT